MVVTITADWIKMSPDGTTSVEHIKRTNVERIIPIFEANAPQYKYPNITVVQIHLISGAMVAIECKSVTNKPTWSTGLQGGVDSAVIELTA